jgi:hypothetical protein
MVAHISPFNACRVKVDDSVTRHIVSLPGCVTHTLYSVLEHLVLFSTVTRPLRKHDHDETWFWESLSAAIHRTCHLKHVSSWLLTQNKGHQQHIPIFKTPFKVLP